MSGQPSPRRVAVDLLCHVLMARRTLDEALDDSAGFAALSGSDRAFARLLTSATLRELGRIDIGLTPLLKTPMERLDAPVAGLLRIGAAQAWCLGTPAHAAVGETVSAAHEGDDTRRAAGLVNAVLRRAVDDDRAFAASPCQAVWPEWLMNRLRESLPEAGLEALAEAHRRQPELHITAKEPAEAAAMLGARLLPPGSLALPLGPVESLAGYTEGGWWVQDAAAALPAKLLAAGPGDHVFDLCAAPGGKTLQLAATGAQVTAIDRSRPRLRRLRANLDRTSLQDRVDVIIANAETWRPEAPADKVLLDAPCSALGTLRRHPEGAWIKRPEDIARFPDIQSRLVMAAADMMREGGTLIYCVCTPLPDEGIQVIQSALESGQWHRTPFQRQEMEGFEYALTDQGDVLTLPTGEFDHDAFFISRLTRL